MQQYSKNPRKITDAQLEQLKSNIQELGDLSGIVHDLNSDEIISGNQRCKIIDINNCTIEITKTYDTPTKEGTVGLGYVYWQGQKLNYRQVRWDEKQCEKACITANKLGGEFDYEILEAKFNTEDLTDWGFNEEEFGTFDVLGDLEEHDTFNSFVKASKDDFAMTFLIPKDMKYKAEVYLRSHTKKYIANRIVEYVNTLDNERV